MLALPALASVITQEGSEAKNQRHKRHRRQQRRRTKRSTLKVMTRNIYLGAHIAPHVAVSSLPELIAAGTALFETVKSTDFPVRAKLLAAEIVAFAPHLVGLQEVSLWRTQTPSDGGFTPNAQDVAFDLLSTLLDELDRQGGKYAAVSVVENFDGEIPIHGASGPIDLRLTDRNVILARTDLRPTELAISNAQFGNFATNASVSHPILGDVTILRGWTAVDVTRHAFHLRLVNTHLEAISPTIQVAQANELLAGPLNTEMATVLTGDLDSDAYGKGTPGQTDTPTYQNMLAAGFIDAWPSDRTQEASDTCCQAEDLLHAESLLSERIDFVLTSGAISSQNAARVGANPDDKTSSGLWPSDHAGVAAVLRLQHA
jgi:endonuclease/exonuclease/phosphatase family metal-dependent hydrolase